MRLDPLGKGPEMMPFSVPFVPEQKNVPPSPFGLAQYGGYLGQFGGT